MTATIPTKEPVVITAGDTVKWTKSLSDYLPGDSWVLSYAFVITGDQLIVTATDNGDGSHLATIAASDTGTLTVGIYHWQAYVTKGTERYRVGYGRVEVKPNFEDQSTGYDNTSHVKNVLDALEATILGKASKDQMSYTIAGTTVSKMTPEDLIKWQNHYRIMHKQELQAEGIDNGDAPSNKGQVRF